MQITDLAPRKVFHFFSEIAKIPHGSGNTSAIASYCLAFAKERGLAAYQDECGNVMIFKDGTPGYEHSEPVILQGHLDMVCEKDPDCPKDMAHEGVELMLDGDYLRANGTTLGGDDGIAVAYILALLDDPGKIAHPPIEALLTVDEEMGMRGANGLDASRLKGKRLINMDSEAEGVLTVSCAGAARIFFRLPIRHEATGAGVAAKRLTLRGLLGGHSGIDIGKSRQNAAKLLAQLLLELSRRTTFRLADFSAGKTMNSIPASGQMVLCFEPSQAGTLDECLDAFQAWYHAVCGHAEPDVRLTIEDVPVPAQCLDAPSTSRTLSALMLVPNGVANISEDIPFFVLTSSNLGRVLIEDETLKLDIMIRSNVNGGREEIVRQLQCLTKGMGGQITVAGEYPAWEYRHISPLRDVLAQVYERMYGKPPQIFATHAGLECGILSKNLPDVDMISMGPNMVDVHTPNERLDIPSVQRCWEYLLQVLAAMK